MTNVFIFYSFKIIVIFQFLTSVTGIKMRPLLPFTFYVKGIFILSQMCFSSENAAK